MLGGFFGFSGNGGGGGGGGSVTSVFGRTGVVVAQSGDYNTDLVTEGSVNLYYTNARAISSTLTGFTSTTGTISASDTVLSAIEKLYGNFGALTYVSSFSGDTTGLTPAVPTTGAISLGGTLNVTHGGTGTNVQFSEGSIPYANASGVYVQDNLNFRWDGGGLLRLFIGNASSATYQAPQTGTLLHIVSNGTANGRVSLDTYTGTNTFGAIFQGRKARGTNSAPSAAITDDTLALIGGDGFGTTGFHNASIGAFLVKAEATLTDSSAPTYLAFYTTVTGATTSAERWRIGSNGNFTNTGGASANAYILLKAGTANMAPLQLTSGTLTNGGNRKAGQIQFNSGVFYGTTADATAEKVFSLQTSVFTSGSVVFVDGSGILDQDNANFYWDNTNKRLGIGTTTPVGSVEVVGTASPKEIYITRYSSDNVSGGFIGRKARGTAGTPSAVLSGDTLALIGARGYGATGFSATNKANVSLVAAENWSDTAQGTYISFNSTTPGGTTRIEVAKMDQTGLTSLAYLMAGNISTTAWTTNGVGLRVSPRTLTDTSSTGTVAAAYTNVLGGNTVAASNAVTYTNYASMYLGDPAAGTNVTFTNKWSLITAGSTRIDGSLNLSAQTASRVATIDSNKNVVSSTVTTTTLSYLDATSSIQTQLNTKIIDWQVFSSAAFNPADASSYFVGNIAVLTASTTVNQRKFKFAKPGTVENVSFTLNQTGNGSNETVTVYLTNVNTSTDYLVGTFTSDFGGSINNQFTFTGLTIAVNATDFWIIKILTPTWVTNPTQWYIQGKINIYS